MRDLALWLTAQLDEDARIVREANTSPEMVTGIPRSYAVAPVALHIAEFADPARVLREIDAKRRLLDDYTVTVRIRDEAATRIKAAGDHPDAKDLDEWDRAQREAAVLEGPVKLAALPYAERPGFREEWAL